MAIDSVIVSENSGGEITVVDAGVGVQVYGDRTYTIDTLPAALLNARLIKTNNAGTERTLTVENYLTFEATEAGYAYVAYDTRVAPPSWLTDDWTPTGETVTTDESPWGFATFNLYGREVSAGEQVVIGGPDGESSDFSNFFIFVDDSDLIPDPAIELTAIEAQENVDGAIVADIELTNIDPAPDAGDFLLGGADAALFEVVGDAAGGFQLKLIDTEALDFEAGAQPSVTVSLGVVDSAAFSPTVANDYTDDTPQGPIDATIVSETSYAEIAVINASVGAPIYGDRDYPLTSLPPELANARLIQTNNSGPGENPTEAEQDRFSTAQSGCVVFTVDVDGFAYVAYDARAVTLPAWLQSGWTDTGLTVTTEETFLGAVSTQTFTLYGKAVSAGETVDLGGADRDGSGAPISNLFAFVDDSNLGVPIPAIELTAIEALENVDGAIVADIALTNVDPAPVAGDFVLGGADAGLFEVTGDAIGGFQLKLIDTEALDFEAGAQPSVTVSLGAVDSAAFSPTVANDPLDDPSITAVIVSENSGGDIDVVEAGIGVEIYGDRTYTIDTLPAALEDGWLIKTNNDTTERVLTVENYVTFEPTKAGFAYVAYDPRVSPPAWLTENWFPTGETVTTQEATFGFATFDLYGRAVSAGEQVVIGGPEGEDSGFSNLFIFVDDSDLIPEPAIDLSAIEAQENVDGAIVADIALTSILPEPTAGDFVLGGADAGLFEVVGDAAGGFQLKLIDTEALDFEAGAQPSVTVSLGAVDSAAFSPTVANDFTDDTPQGPIDATIVSETSYAEIAVINASVGAPIYGDRDYPLTSLPPELANARLIQTNNSGPGENPTEAEQDRFSTAQSGYVVFTVDADGYVYVAYDARAVTLPAWLQSGWTDTGAVVTTEETFLGAVSTQTFTLYGKAVAAGETVDLGGADRDGSGAAISNLFAFVDDSDLGVLAPDVSLTAIAATENVDGAVVADIILTDIDPAPLAGDFVLGGADAALFEVTGDATGGFQLKLIDTEALDFEAVAQPSVTVSVGGATSTAFSPTVANDPGDDPTLDAVIVSENSGGDITVVDAGVGAEIYGDRTYTIDTLPPALENARLIKTNNDTTERVLAVANYVTFEPTQDGFAYVAYDPRVAPPAWLTENWFPTGETVTTQEATFGFATFDLYGRAVSGGEQVVIGGPDGEDAGFSNLFIFVDDSDLIPAPAIDLTAIEAQENEDGAIVADIALTSILPEPSAGDFVFGGATPLCSR